MSGETDRGRFLGIGAGKDADRVLGAQLLSALQAHAQSTTEFMGRLQGQMINNILLVETFAIPAAGYVVRHFHAAAGYATVTPLQATNAMTVESAATADGSVPTAGVGVHVVPAGSQGKTIPLASRALTVHGTEGDRVSIVVGTAVPLPVMD